MTRRNHLLVALALGLATTTLLSLGHRRVGYVRDEGIYFLASRHYAAWAARLLEAPREALAAPARDRAFRPNNEHPALMKLAGGVAARVFARPGHPAGQPEPAPAGLLPLMPEGAAMRLPAQVLAGLAVALLFLAGAALARPVPPSSPPQPVPGDTPPVPPTSPPPPRDPANLPLLAGLLAALWFIALPHVWFHAGLHCFDVPVAAATLAVVLIYRRALHSARWALALGPALGVAISIKHNALFIPLLLGVSPAIIWHAAEVKQYAGDAACTTALLLLWEFEQDPGMPEAAANSAPLVDVATLPKPEPEAPLRVRYSLDEGVLICGDTRRPWAWAAEGARAARIASWASISAEARSFMMISRSC